MHLTVDAMIFSGGHCRDHWALVGHRFTVETRVMHTASSACSRSLATGFTFCKIYRQQGKPHYYSMILFTSTCREERKNLSRFLPNELMHTQPLTWDVNLFAPCGSEVPNLFKICISLLDQSSWMILFLFFILFLHHDFRFLEYQTL